jgi:hypothetical protein
LRTEDLCQEVIQMKKLAITKWWIWGEVVMIPGYVLTVGSALALVAHLQTLGPLSWTSLAPDGYSQTMWNLAWLGVALLAIGMAVQLVAWLGAVMNTRRLEDGRWFKVLLLSQLAGILTMPAFGLGGLISGTAMIAYLVGGPNKTEDGLAAQSPSSVVTKGTIRGWAFWAIAGGGVGTFLMLLISYLTNRGGPLEGKVWLSLTLLLLAGGPIGAGVIALAAAWWGAIFNTHQVADRSWFNALLWSGIASVVTAPLFGIGAVVGFGVLIAYVLAGPDGLASQRPPLSKPAAPPSSVATAS